MTKLAGSGSRIRGMDPRIRIHPKMSWIRNTDKIIPVHSTCWLSQPAYTSMLPPQEPDPSDQLAEDWTSWLAHLDLDSRQVWTIPFTIVFFRYFFSAHLRFSKGLVACTHTIFVMYLLLVENRSWYPHGFRSVEASSRVPSRDSNSGLPRTWSRRTNTVLVHLFLSLFSVSVLESLWS